MKALNKPISDKKKTAVVPAAKSTIASSSNTTKTRAAQKATSRKSTALEKFSPAWVVLHPKDSPDNKLELIAKIREGVKKMEWKELISAIGATEKEFEFILPTSISSMQKKEVYSLQTSERIYEISRLFGLGSEVFDSLEQFKNWLLTPSKALGHKKPFELLDSSFGFEIVENEIARIQYNVYS